MRDLKDCLKDDECIVLLDFTENYSYFVQGAVHGVLLLDRKSKVINYKEQNYLNSISYCVLSDYLDHNANAVHVFTYHMLRSLKILLPQMYCFIACVLHIFSSRYCLLSQVYCVLSHQGIAFVIVIIFLIALLLFNGYNVQ